MWPYIAIGLAIGAGVALLRRGGGGSRERIYWPVSPRTAPPTISPFGARRAGGDRIHAGVDVGAMIGAKVIAMGDGVVLWPVSGFQIGADLQAVAIRHADADYIYAEIYVDPKFMVPGQVVRAGEVIGTVGRNGDNRSMLHIEAWEHSMCPKGFTPWLPGARPPGLLDVGPRLQTLIDVSPPKVG